MAIGFRVGAIQKLHTAKIDLANFHHAGQQLLSFPFIAQNIQCIKEGCYNCHANTPGELVVTRTYLADAMGDDFTALNAETASCAQCHVEYYSAPETKAVTLPYSNMETMHSDSILAFFEESNFADYTNPRTGVKQIKVQHPEFETYMGKDSVHSSIFSCADCHMCLDKAEGLIDEAMGLFKQ